MTAGSPADLLLFAAVVREGSFTRAARQLGVTKQSASARVAKLERRLGVRLLERTTRRLRVTEAGGRYYERCSAIAALLDEADREVQQLQVEPSGLLRLSAPVLYGRRYLAPVVASYLARHPSVRVEVVLADRRVHLVEEGIDLAIRIGELDDSSLTARKLGEGHVYLVASPAFLAACGPLDAIALRRARCIATRLGEVWPVGDAAVRIDPALVVNDLEVACEAAIAGVGIARVPSIVCRGPVAAGQLCVVLPEHPPQRRPVYAVLPSRRYVAAKVRVFLESLAAIVEPMAPLPPPAPAPPAAAPSRRRAR
jgi:DNA-binding transcriptional LysR family regulator